MERPKSASPEIEDPSAGKEAADAAAKRARKKQKRRRWQDADRELDESNGLNLGLARYDPQLIADHLAKQTRKFEPELTTIEAEEWRIPVNAILDTSDWTEKRLSEKMPAFLRHIHAKRKNVLDLSDAPKANGSPHTIVVTGAALRAADLARVLRCFQSKKARIAKLFSKHIKLSEATEMCQKTRIGMGVGTPHRLIELLDAGTLSVDRLERIVVDFSRIDRKTRGVLDVKETQAPLMKFLARKELKERYDEGKVDLAFY